ncbi:MAG: hypothetical protein EOP76_09925 [Variovorax sp.]|nr:MAG: hypothetical protein EOP76_09925 [Variovorax sp.]
MPLPDGAFDGRLAFQDHLRGAMAEAASQNWREIVFSDPDFADWPLGERASIEALQAWAASGRSLVMLARHFKVFERDHARFVRWRQTWSHIIDARACEGAGLPTVPSALWTPTWCLRRIDVEHDRGHCGPEPERRRAVREAVDECLRHGRPAFAASTLGL